MSRARLLAGAAVAALALAACATLRLAYDHADLLARWRADNYLELHGAEARELDRRIDLFFAWHRAKALPQYAGAAAEAERRLEDGLSPADLVWGYDSLLRHVQEGLRQAATQVAPLLDRLDAAQIAHIERGFAEDNRRFAREHLRGSDDERRARRAERMRERLEDWVGGLSESQVERVRRYAERVPEAGELRARDRERLQAGVLAIVRAREAAQRLPEFAARFQDGRDPVYVEASAAYRREFFALLTDLDRSLSPEQRERARERLRRYGEDFTALAAAGAAKRAQ